MQVSREAVAAALALPDTTEEGALHVELLAAVSAGDLQRVQQLIATGADVRYQEQVTEGRSALMAAAAAGHEAITLCLLTGGAPWNAQDRAGASAGDHAHNAGQTQVRVQSRQQPRIPRAAQHALRVRAGGGAAAGVGMRCGGDSAQT